MRSFRSPSMRKARMALGDLAGERLVGQEEALGTCCVRPDAPLRPLARVGHVGTMARTTPMKPMPDGQRSAGPRRRQTPRAARLGMAATGTNTRFSRELLRQELAIGSVEPGQGRRPIVRQLLMVRQAMAEMPEEACDGTGANDEGGGSKS